MIKKRNFKSIVATGVIALASATLLAACGSKSTSSKDEINWYTPTEILTLDVSKNTDHYSALAIGNSESNLLRVDKNGKLQPDLAEKVDVSADGLTYTATLILGNVWLILLQLLNMLTSLQILTLLMLQILLPVRRVLKSWVLRLRVIKLSLPCQILLHNLRVFCHSQILFRNIRNL